MIIKTIPIKRKKKPNIFARNNTELLKISAIPSLVKKPKISFKLLMGRKEIIDSIKPERIKNKIIKINNIFEALLIFLLFNLIIKNFY